MHDHINRVLQVLPFASEVSRLLECLSSRGTCKDDQVICMKPYVICTRDLAREIEGLHEEDNYMI